MLASKRDRFTVVQIHSRFSFAGVLVSELIFFSCFSEDHYSQLYKLTQVFSSIIIGNPYVLCMEYNLHKE